MPEVYPGSLPPVGAAPKDLPYENPPQATDYCDMGATWWCDEGQVTIKDGQTADFPSDGVFCAPPVHGRGIVRNECTLSFDIVSGSVTTVIGVSNPSENARPCKPFVGCSYPNPSAVPLIAGQRVHLVRVDIIDVGDNAGPADIRSWTMNPGAGGGSGRGAYPSLAGSVTAVNGDAVIANIQMQSFAVTL
ncbi:MAG TPA: hypothetical protein VKD24_07105 [Candidatus Angelobacter sp.]|nr:hypothetical protein [Candidatus Angelobacter sp.]